ncbi:MAG: alpha/beta hydrolase [Polyangiaceae bacterium]|nr:alpha/beta hydrolase [Polyangiaceae bacterium]
MQAGEQFVPADDGTRLYVRTRPGPSAVVSLLCDGIACDGFIWKYLWDLLATRTPVAHWNYRGHGRSHSPVDPERITVEDHARDLGAVRTSIGDPEVVLFGHSMGCQVLLEHYRQRPEKVRALVLLCGAPGRVTHTFKGTDALAQVLPRMIDVVDRHPRLARALWGGVPPELALRVAFALGEVDGKLMNPKDLLPYLEHMVDIDLPMFLRMLRYAGEHTAEDMLQDVKVPALVVASDRDSFTPPRLAEQMAKTLPHGELFMISGTHAAPLEQKQLVHDRVLAFLDGVLST